MGSADDRGLLDAAAAHARPFATIRSYIQTAAKHDENLLGVLTQLFTTGAWPPPDPTPARHHSLDRKGYSPATAGA